MAISNCRSLAEGAEPSVNAGVYLLLQGDLNSSSVEVSVLEVLDHPRPPQNGSLT